MKFIVPINQKTSQTADRAKDDAEFNADQNPWTSISGTRK